MGFGVNAWFGPWVCRSVGWVSGVPEGADPERIHSEYYARYAAPPAGATPHPSAHHRSADPRRALSRDAGLFTANAVSLLREFPNELLRAVVAFGLRGRT